MKKILLFIIIILSCIFFLNYSNWEYEQGLPVDKNDKTMVIIDIEKGSSTQKIAKQLLENNLIKSRKTFKNIAKKNNFDTKFKAGKYQLSKSMSSYEIAEIIANGNVYRDLVKVTIPEGYDYEMVVAKLFEEDIISNRKIFDELAQMYDFNYKFINNDGNYIHRLEGYLFPATYEFEKGVDELTVIKTMLDKFNSIFKEEYYEQAKRMNMSINDIVTLASIIEREGASDEEFPIISGVFYNRINKKMKLESCATVQYILNERKPVLSYDDIKIQSPYNTYINAGLPPSPIAMPGEKAIKAALYPAKTDYYFFVVSGKNDGKHIFSKTYEEHLKAAKKALNK